LNTVGPVIRAITWNSKSSVSIGPTSSGLGFSSAFTSLTAISFCSAEVMVDLLSLRKLGWHRAGASRRNRKPFACFPAQALFPSV
jgi:hypothetical protein